MKTIRFLTKSTAILMIIAIFSFNHVEAQDSPGSVVFLTEDNEMAVEGENQFEILDNIYINIFLDKPLSYYYNQYNYTYNFDLKRLHYNYALRVYVDDELRGQWLYEMPPNDFNRLQALHFPLATDEQYEKQLYGNMANSWVNLVRGLQSGTHNIRMAMVLLYEDIKGKNPPVLAEGKFTLSVDRGKLETFMDIYKTHLPEATVIAPVIEQQVLNASEHVIEGAEPLEAFITDVTGDWSYTYDKHGNIRYRNIVASVVYQLRSGECWVKAGYYDQEHKGFGEFADMNFVRDAEGYSDYEIDCNLLQ